MASLFLLEKAFADGITSIAKTNKFLKQAEEFMKKKDFQKAITSYESAFKEDPEIPAQAHLNLGSAYYQTGKYAKAQKSYLTAANTLSNPALKSQAYLQMGNIYATQKDYKSALEWYKRSLKTQPENDMARFNYELAYKLLKKQEEQEKKNNPEKQDPKQNQNQNQEQNKDQKENQNKQEQNGQKGQDQNEKKPGEKNQENKTGQQKGQDNNKNQKESGSKPGADESKEAENAIAKEGEKEKGNGKEEQEDKAGDKDSKNKGKEETEGKDPNAIKVDKNKLQQIGLSEDQAKALLEAMRQSEVKYLQQRRFKSKKGGSDSDKPKW